MTDAPTSDAPIRPAELAAYLAARMCHDFISPASAIVSGLDLLEDPSAQDMREDAMGLIGTSARKLADLLAFTRVAFGAAASAETFDARELEKLAQGVFAHMRAQLDWQVETPAVNKPSARTLLNLAQMAGAAPATGGTAPGAARRGRGSGSNRHRHRSDRPPRPPAPRGAGRPARRRSRRRAARPLGAGPLRPPLHHRRRRAARSMADVGGEKVTLAATALPA